MAAILSVMLSACGDTKVTERGRRPRVTHPPVTLAGAHGLAGDQAIAMNAKGDAVAVWAYARSRAVGAREVIQAATRRAGGRFSAPVTLSARGKQDALGPAPAIDAAGNVIVVWQRGHPIDHSNDRVQASMRPAGGRFSRPVTLSAPGRTSQRPQIAMDDAGNATVVWQRGKPGDIDPKDTVVQATMRPSDGSFSAPRTLSSPTSKEPFPVLAMGSAGQAIVAWQQQTRTSSVVQASLGAPGGRFSKAVDLSGRDRSIESPAVAIDRAGDATVVWERGTSDRTSFVQAATRPAGGAFAKPVDLTGRTAAAVDPHVAMDGSGDTIVVFKHFRDPDAWAQASIRPAGGDFSKPVTLSTRAQRATDATIAMNQAGRAVAIWGSLIDGAGAYASFGDAGGHFSNPVTLAPALSRFSFEGVDTPLVAVDGAGQAVAVWQRDLVGKGHFVVQSVTSDPARP